jgi:hypothetical protein
MTDTPMAAKACFQPDVEAGGFERARGGSCDMGMIEIFFF